MLHKSCWCWKLDTANSRTSQPCKLMGVKIFLADNAAENCRSHGPVVQAVNLRKPQADVWL